MNMAPPLAVVILISGRGSNMQAIINATDPLLVSVKAVISNRPNAQGLTFARDAGIPTAVVDHTQFESRPAFDQALQTCIDTFAPGLVVLAGFMRILTPAFVRQYAGRMLNIHPSLLPEFKGLHTHERALASGAKVHGASVHFVTEDLDSGPVILQARVPVLPTDTVDTLAARVLKEEHRIYPQAIHWFAQGRLQLREQCVLLDGQPVVQYYGE